MTDKTLPPDTQGDPAATPKKPVKDPRAKLYQPEMPLILASSPHFHARNTVPQIMWHVILALLPATVLSLYFFRWQSGGLILAAVCGALASEWLVNMIRKEQSTLFDGSAVITGLLLALTLPPSFSMAGAVLGAAVAILIGKHLFGGLGYNIFNPALLGRAFLQASFPVQMTTWSFPLTDKYRALDGVTTATPLGLYKFEHINTDVFDLFWGNIGGSLGETSAFAIFLGGAYLLLRKFADWRIPASMGLTVIVVGGCFWLIDPVQYPTPWFHLFSGGFMLGAFFMATDMVTSPVSARGAWIFGTGCGALLVIIRLFGGLPEGVMYSILLMNAFTPLINRSTRPKFFGEVRA